MALVSCGAPPVDDESCEGVDFSCDCPNGEAFASCVDGELFCDCVSGPGDPPGSGGSELGSGGADDGPASGGQTSGGTASGGDTGGAESGGSSSGGESSGGSSSGGSASGGETGSGGSLASGGSVGMCSSTDACASPGSREYYCGGDPESPSCTKCIPGWCNCDQGSTEYAGTLEDGCDFYGQWTGNTSCSIICSICVNNPEVCD